MILRLVRQQQRRQHEHQHRADQPVLHQRDAQDLLVLEDLRHILVLHLGKGGVHHQDQADGDGDVGGADLEGVDEGFRAGDEIAQTDPQRHGGKDPEGQPAVEEGKLAGKMFTHGVPPK